MTQVRRKTKQQQRVTLVSVFLVLAAILVLSILLFQYDTFPRSGGRASSQNSAATLASPETLLLRKRVIEDSQKLAEHKKKLELEKQQQQQQQQQQRKAAVEDSKEDDDIDQTDDEEKEEGGANKIELSEGKRYAMKLANLKSSGDDAATTGVVIFETRPAWAPKGVEHFDKLVASKYYDECRFFRVVKDFIVQFGMHGDPKVHHKWVSDKLEDDPVVQTNSRGTLTYATSGPNTRTTQLFINTKDAGNAFLDKQGFSPFAIVTKGMEYVDKINDEYAQQPIQGHIEALGNEYLKENFPNLSYIESIREISADEEG